LTQATSCSTVNHGLKEDGLRIGSPPKNKVSLLYVCCQIGITSIRKENNVFFDCETVETFLTKVKSKTYEDQFHSPSIPVILWAYA
jgi:hypothetical protein